MNRRVTEAFLVLMIAALMLPVRSYGAVKLMPVMSIYAADKGGLSEPEDVAYSAPQHSVIVADTGNGRLMEYAFENGRISNGTEIKLPEIVYPIEVQADSKGDIFVLDGRERRIVHLSQDGKFVGNVEPSGMPDPDKFVPKSFKIGPNDNIYILDILGARIVVLGPDGKFASQIALPQDAGFISDLAVVGGEIIINDSARSVLYAAPAGAAAFSPITGNLKEFSESVSTISVDKNGLIYVVDRNGGSVVFIGKDGVFHGRSLTLGWNEGLVYFPSRLCLGDGYAFVADTENNRIQIFEIKSEAK